MHLTPSVPYGSKIAECNDVYLCSKYNTKNNVVHIDTKKVKTQTFYNQFALRFPETGHGKLILPP